MGKANQPKSKCCVSKSRCRRCPIRMLKEGTLPDGFTVKKRKLVKTTPLVAVEAAKLKKNKKKVKQPIAA